jgi:hypothetical protein
MLKNLVVPAIALLAAAFLFFAQEKRNADVRTNEAAQASETQLKDGEAAMRAAGKATAAGVPDWASRGSQGQAVPQAGQDAAKVVYADPADAPTGLAATPAEVPPPPNAGRVRFYGVIYDLESLVPVAGANVTAVIPAMDNVKQNVITDAVGHYRFDIPQGERVFVQVAAEGFKTGQLADVDPPYSTLPPNYRKNKAGEVTVTDLGPHAPEYGHGENIVKLDLVMVKIKAGETDAFIDLPVAAPQRGGQVFIPSEARHGNDASLAPVAPAPQSTGGRNRQISGPRMGN